MVKDDGLIQQMDPKRENRLRLLHIVRTAKNTVKAPEPSPVLILCLERKEDPKQQRQQKHCSVNRTESSNNPGSSVMAVVS